jgi:hypothetical protein
MRGRRGFTRNNGSRLETPARTPNVRSGAFVGMRKPTGLSRQPAINLRQPPAFSLNETRLGAWALHAAIVLGPLEETLRQRRALLEAVGEQACSRGAKIDDWKIRRLDQTIEVPQAFGLQSVDEEELRHALVGGLMGWANVKNALEALPGAREVFRRPCVFGVVHPLRAVIRELSARLLRALARFTLLRFAQPLRFSAHNSFIVGAGIRIVNTEDRRTICRSWGAIGLTPFRCTLPHAASRCVSFD